MQSVTGGGRTFRPGTRATNGVARWGMVRWANLRRINPYSLDGAYM